MTNWAPKNSLCFFEWCGLLGPVNSLHWRTLGVAVSTVYPVRAQAHHLQGICGELFHFDQSHAVVFLTKHVRHFDLENVKPFRE